MKNKILICMGTSGISAGAEKVYENLRGGLKKRNLDCEIIKVGDRGLFRDILIDVIIGEKRFTYEFITKEDVKEIINHLLNGKPFEKKLAKDDYYRFFSGQMRIVLQNCGEIDPENIDGYILNKGYEALKKALKMEPEGIIEVIKKSGLRGRGGAGFPTGLKWEFCRKEQNNQKYLICNADEGDPGAFMDRSILEGDPHSVIEGMIIGAYAIGANIGYIYCRAEYPLALKRLEIAISQARENGFLGKNILESNFSFDIDIKQGAGAFVCGEETALIASIEGKRGMPRLRPPFPAEKGLFGKPTVINNVETLANIRHIIIKGADWFSSIGYKSSKGTKVFALAGKVKNTGLVEAPMGTAIREIIFGPGGGMLDKKIKAVQIGGPSGGCIPESLLDTPIDYESINKTGAIMGSGGMIVMDQDSCMVDISKFFLNFTVSESCGKCVPCRVGLKRMLEVIEKITQGKGNSEHIKFLQDMSLTIKETSLCGLGNTAPNPVLTTLRYFAEEYESHIKHKICNSLDCADLIKFEVNKDCKKCGICFNVCPVNAIDWKKGEFAVIDKNKCTKCKACIKACKYSAIK